MQPAMSQANSINDRVRWEKNNRNIQISHPPHYTAANKAKQFAVIQSAKPAHFEINIYSGFKAFPLFLRWAGLAGLWNIERSWLGPARTVVYMVGICGRGHTLLSRHRAPTPLRFATGIFDLRLGWSLAWPAPEAQRPKQSVVYWYGQKIKGRLPRPLIVIHNFLPFV